jgi:hypothetical protein
MNAAVIIIIILPVFFVFFSNLSCSSCDLYMIVSSSSRGSGLGRKKVFPDCDSTFSISIIFGRFRGTYLTSHRALSEV